MMRKQAITYYGGKYYHLDWLLGKLPRGYRCFVDVFGGSAVVSLNVDYAVQVYNDVDGEVVNFFRVLRDNGEELQRLLLLTPYAYEEYRNACDQVEEGSEMERARKFFVAAMQARNGLVGSSWAFSRTLPRRGMGAVVSKWLTKVDKLLDVVGKLRTIQIESKEWDEIIDKYDHTSTLFYCDPPYLPDTRQSVNAYRYEMFHGEHSHLASVLRAVIGGVVVSGYRCLDMEDLYPDFLGWVRMDDKERSAFSSPAGLGETKTTRTESVWVNESVHNQLQKEYPAIF